jgi:hypothetical protein
MTFNLLDLPNEALSNINLDDKLDNNISFNDSFIDEKDKPFNYFNNDLLLSKKKEPLTIDFKNDFFINAVLDFFEKKLNKQMLKIIIIYFIIRFIFLTKERLIMFIQKILV